MSSVAIGRPRPLVLADLIALDRGRLAHVVRDVLLVVGAAGFVGALAQISIHLSFTPVPITGQTLGVLLAGTALGWRRAAASMALYAVVGVAGVPWFAGGTSGYASASFGYIVGFFFAAAACGYLAERGVDRSVLGSVPAMIVGEIIIYAFGLTWLALDQHLNAGTTLAQGLVPFVVGDAFKATLAASLLPVAWQLAGRQAPASRPAGPTQPGSEPAGSASAGPEPAESASGGSEPVESASARSASARSDSAVAAPPSSAAAPTPSTPVATSAPSTASTPAVTSAPPDTCGA
jgi:biotin transport system substrate-specific component